jgi:molecular chaperone GrpE
MSRSKDKRHHTPADGAAHSASDEWTLGKADEAPAHEPFGSDAKPDVAPSDGGATAPSSELDSLRAQLGEKERELTEFKDKYLRALADTENMRKRMRQQSEESIRLQRENLLRELLPMVDNLERAVDAARGGGNGKPIVEGVEMVLRSLLDFLRGQGVIPQEAVGQPFNPQYHEAVDHVESPDHPPNTVISEFHRGYRIGERVLRPARVAVAKGPAGSHKDSEGGNGGVEGQ